MRKKPLVAIVGRPNVGKSTFFNRICGRRISIVDDLAGVTRDRIYADAEWCGCSFTLVDTGGLDFEDRGEIQKNILNQKVSKSKFHKIHIHQKTTLQVQTKKENSP